MSFIQQVLKCNKCQFEFNVATGTFGYGLPTECPECHKTPDFSVVKEGYNIEEIKTNGRADEALPL